MTRLITRIATGIAIIGLTAPAFAATSGKSMTTTTPAAQSSVLHKTHKHKKVAAAEKTESKKSPKKRVKKGTAKSMKTDAPATPSATPTPASK